MEGLNTTISRLSTKKLLKIIEVTKIRPSPPSQQPTYMLATRTRSKEEWDVFNNNDLLIIIACLDSNQQLHIKIEFGF